MVREEDKKKKKRFEKWEMEVSDGVAGAAGYGCIRPLSSPFHGSGETAALAN